jgi:tetratricopeptide (TPR) repeat protein
MLRDIKAENELALAYAGYGRLHKHQGRIEESRDHLTRALEIFERPRHADGTRHGPGGAG